MHRPLGSTPWRVLVTDGIQRKSLAAVRALGKKGVKVTVSECTGLCASFFSRHCGHRLLTPSPVLEPEKYCEALVDFFRRRPHHAVLPMEEDTLLLLVHNRRRLEPFARLPFADYETLLFLRDKAEVSQRARALGIPAPQTWVLESPEDAGGIECTRERPMVVKPAVGSGSRGVSYAEDAGGLVRAAAGLFAAGEGRVLVQERLPRDGKGIGVSLLMGRGGDLKAFFVHRRLREFPVSGGPSTLRESVYRPEAVQAAHELLKSTDFRGVAMVEFKTDARDGKIKLLEVNPRFWGSLSLAVDAGVNFPYLLLLEAFDIPFPPLDRYRIGHRCRWLLPGDIQHFIANREQRKTTPGFFRFRERNLTYDVLKWNDPMPALGTLLSWFPYARGPQFEHIRNRRTI